MLNTSRYAFGICALAFAACALVLLKLTWDVPKPMLLFAAATYTLSLVIFESTCRIPNHSKRNKIALLTVVWFVTAASILAVLFRLDRVGWWWFQATGYDFVIEERLPGSPRMSVALFLQQAPFFSVAEGEPDTILLRAGTYEIDRTLVIPAGTKVRIEPGAVLQFGAAASLVSYSPIIAQGTPEAPIVFMAQHYWRKWGSVGIVGGQGSVFKHTVFESGRRAQVNGVNFFGALSLIDSQADVSHSTFRNLKGKDGLYVVDGHIMIHDNRFENCSKDGLDLQGAEGEVFNNTFIDCADEGMDLSENEAVRVYDNIILDRRGGRLEAEQNYDAIVAANFLGYSRRMRQSH